MKILNLYAGIGGNRKLWGNEHKITAVEINPEIAKIYQDFFPNDKVIVADAHQYLLEHYKEFDFIWSSPPCQSHSMCNHFLKGQGIIRYPDMKLYEEIILLQTHAKCKWVVENVKGYYLPLIKPQEAGRHYFWSNFKIGNLKVEYDIGTMNRQASKSSQRKAIIREAQIPELIDLHGLNDFKLKNKRQVLRNCVLPKVGLHIFNEAFKVRQNTVGDFLSPKGESLIAINQNQKTIG
jgi:DNA (cytosine-5)-methyltransferase 1